MTVKAAIVEDSPEHAARLREYLNSMETDTLSFHLSVYNSAEEFLEAFSAGKFQILFMDIQLPKMDGLSAAGRVRTVDEDVVIVFITSAPQFAINGYEVNAKDYILKPVIYDSFVRKVQRLLPSIRTQKDNLVAINKSGANADIIPVDKLIFVEVFGHRLVYHCTYGDFDAYGKISDAEEALKPYKFLRCNRNAVINPAFIDRVQGNTVKMGDYELVISSPRKKNFLQELNDWIAR